MNSDSVRYDFLSDTDFQAFRAVQWENQAVYQPGAQTTHRRYVPLL
jgi:hypothetical protein